MTTDREKDLEAAEWLDIEIADAKHRAEFVAANHGESMAAPVLGLVAVYERAAAALRERANKENTDEAR